MALEQRESRLANGNGRVSPDRMQGTGESSLGELFGQLSRDAQHLIQQEVALAKAELRETGSALARDGAKIGVAAALGLIGALAATAFVIIGLGDLLDNYWASALLVTVIYLAVAAFLATSAMKDIKGRRMKPEETLETLREDADWAKREARDLKTDWTSPARH